MKFLTAFFLALFCTTFAHADDLAAQVLAEVNLARTNPQHYAQIVASRSPGQPRKEGDRAVQDAIRFLEKARPLPPLTRSEGLAACALGHVLEQGAAGSRGHNSADGSSPWKRMERLGKWSGRAAENIAYGPFDARGFVVMLIVDDGVRNRAHRLNIFGSAFRVVGIACGSHAAYRGMCVMDFATAFEETAPGLAAK
jgi:uncharacterized protein YkwD